MAGNEFFGFDTTQAKTLDRLMKSDDAGLAALATKLNTDAGVTDTNYDTNPQV